MTEATNREVELKLRDSAVIRDNARAAIGTRQLVSTYYDTPDHRLAGRGLALRVRRDGRKVVQTLKAAQEGQGAAHDRAEWEVEIDVPRPDLTAFAEPAVLELTGLVLPDELQPCFETRVRRDVALLEWRDGRDNLSVIELALDEGTIEARGREEPIAEVELELKEGRADALFALAEALRAVVPLAIETQDKARRGYRLAAGLLPQPRKSGPIELAPALNVEDGLQIILRHTLAHWLANEQPARNEADAEGVHQLRVALRRLRSVLTLFKDVLAASARRQWNDEFRWLLQCLSPARDLDVFLEGLLPPVMATPGLEASCATLGEEARARRTLAYDGVRAALASERYARLALAFAVWVERRGWREGVDVDILLEQRQPLRSFAARNLAKRHKRVRKRGRQFERLSEEERHKVRIALKKVRYGVDYFAPLFDKKHVRYFGKRLSALQDELGHLNDVATARRLVLDLVKTMPEGPARETTSLGAGIVIGWHGAHVAAFAAAAVESFADYVAAEPFWGGDAA